jgi:hypothetical protein
LFLAGHFLRLLGNAKKAERLYRRSAFLFPVYGMGPNLLVAIGLEVMGVAWVRVILEVCERFMMGHRLTTYGLRPPWEMKTRTFGIGAIIRVRLKQVNRSAFWGARPRD